MATHYVSVTGTATWAASTNIDTPCSLNTAISNAAAGDLVYLRAGTYSQTWTFTASGSSGNYITFAGYPSDLPSVPEIDGGDTGDGTGLGSGSSLVIIEGSYVELKDFTIQKSGGNNVRATGDYVKLTNLYVTRSYANGIRCEGDHDTVDECRVYYNSTISEMNSDSGYCGGVEGEFSTYLTVKNCTVWNNWGEGINPYDSSHATIEDNISYDNMRMNYLLDSCEYATFQRNLSYQTAGHVCLGYTYSDPGGFYFEHESDETTEPTDNVVINNMHVGVVGYAMMMADWTGAWTATNHTIANNTFYMNSGDYQCVYIKSTLAFSNSIFKNNIVIQEDSGQGVINTISAPAGLTLAYNNWSKAAPAWAQGTGDQTGDPKLTKTGTLSPGVLTSAYCKLQSDSPAINNGTTLAAVTTDFFQTARPVGASPDIGAYEYDVAGSSLSLRYRVL